MSVSSFNNNTHKGSILANSPPTSPTYSSSPTHSMFAMLQAQKSQKRLKSRFQKHLRKPPSFDTYLLRRTNSVSSVSSTSSYDSNTSTTSNEDQTIVLPQAQVQTTSHANHPSLIRRVSSAIRFTGLFDGAIPDDSSSVAYSSSSDWDPRDDENDEEEEEEFEFINSSRNGCHRSSFSSGC